MRSDMKDVLFDDNSSANVLGYRNVRSKKNKKSYHDDNYFTKDSMSSDRVYTFPRGQGDNIGPVKKYLTKNLGRRWDDVWSDICSVNDERSVGGYHLRQHVRYMVITKTIMRNGIVYRNDGVGYRQIETPVYRNEYYVCPISGILKIMDHRQKSDGMYLEKYPMKKITDTMYFLYINNMWHTVILKKLRDLSGYTYSSLIDQYINRRSYKLTVQVDNSIREQIEYFHSKNINTHSLGYYTKDSILKNYQVMECYPTTKLDIKYFELNDVFNKCFHIHKNKKGKKK